MATAWAGWPASARSAPSLPADAGWTAATTRRLPGAPADLAGGLLRRVTSPRITEVGSQGPGARRRTWGCSRFKTSAAPHPETRHGHRPHRPPRLPGRRDRARGGVRLGPSQCLPAAPPRPPPPRGAPQAGRPHHGTSRQPPRRRSNPPERGVPTGTWPCAVPLCGRHVAFKALGILRHRGSGSVCQVGVSDIARQSRRAGEGTAEDPERRAGQRGCPSSPPAFRP